MRSIALPSWIERLAGLDPRPLPPHAFGVTRREIVAATFAPTGRGEAAELRTLLEAQSTPLPPGTFGGGSLGGAPVDPRPLVEAVAGLVGRLARAPKHASLVLPDAWARSLMLDATELPDDPDARREMLRFRLKRLVPFRVEELRVAATPLAAEGGLAERSIAVFANDGLVAALEDAFAAAGVRLGWISGTTAALQAGLWNTAPEGGDGIRGVAAVDADGFALALGRGGEPLVWRQKSFTEELSDVDRERLLTAELRLTRTFLEERLPGARIIALHLAAPRAVEPFWQRVLEEGLGAGVSRLRAEHVGLASAGVESTLESAGAELLALAGAVARRAA